MSFNPFDLGSPTGFAGMPAAARPQEAGEVEGAEVEGAEVKSAAIEFDAPAIHVGLEADPDAAPGPAGSLQTLANYLTSGYWNDSGRTTRWYDVAGNGHVLYYNVSGFSGDANGLTAARQAMAREAFMIYEEVLGINFVETTSTSTAVDFFFRDNSGGAGNSTTVYSGNGGSIDYSTINVDVNWNGGSSSIGDYTFQTFLHEIGHALGLGHQGNYNGSATYANDATWANDSWQQSMMSYFDQIDNTDVNASYARLIGPMAADFLGLNDLYAWQGYGVSNAFNGNTVWGFGTNISGFTSGAYANVAALADTNAFCIVDGSGIDTVDFSGYAANQVINLQEVSNGSTTGSISNVGGLTGNMTIAVGTIIENAVGGSGNDVIYGNAANNALYGLGGNDVIYSFSGSDYVRGGDGNDTILTGGGGNDVAYGDAGDDVIYWGPPSPSTSDSRWQDGGIGNDWIYGGGTVFGGVTFNLAAGTYNNGGSFTETWVNFENYYNWGTGHETVIGTDGDNYLATGSGNNTLTGAGGTDTLYGGAGDDTLLGGFVTDTVDGGDGNDTLRVLNGEFYDNSAGGAGTDTLDHSASSYAGSTFDFELGTITGTGINGTSATLSGIEIYRDGSGGNTIISDGNSNTYYGNAGNDTMVAEIGGEFMYGGAGIDTINLARWSGPYAVDMTTGSSNYGSETYQEFENLISGAGDDTVTGTSGANTIQTGGGNDAVYGAAGNDLILVGNGNDWVDAQVGNDTVRGGNGNDNLSGGFDADVIIGGAGRDTFTFKTLNGSNLAATDRLQAGDGGAAFDGAGFALGDWIDVSGIDANATAANNQAFVFGGTGKGHLWCINSGTNTRVVGNVDNDAAFEFQLDIIDGATLANAYKAVDFIL